MYAHITVADALTIGEMRRCKLISGQAGLSPRGAVRGYDGDAKYLSLVTKKRAFDDYWLLHSNDGGRLIRLLYHLNNIGGAGHGDDDPVCRAVYRGGYAVGGSAGAAAD
jgi:hypothetical protein